MGWISKLKSLVGVVIETLVETKVLLGGCEKGHGGLLRRWILGDRVELQWLVYHSAPEFAAAVMNAFPEIANSS